MSLVNLESLTSFRLVHLEEEHLFEVLLQVLLHPPPHALLLPVRGSVNHEDALGAGPCAVRERHLHLLVLPLRWGRGRRDQGDVAWGGSERVGAGERGNRRVIMKEVYAKCWHYVSDNFTA